MLKYEMEKIHVENLETKNKTLVALKNAMRFALGVIVYYDLTNSKELDKISEFKCHIASSAAIYYLLNNASDQFSEYYLCTARTGLNFFGGSHTVAVVVDKLQKAYWFSPANGTDSARTLPTYKGKSFLRLEEVFVSESLKSVIPDISRVEGGDNWDLEELDSYTINREDFF